MTPTELAAAFGRLKAALDDDLAEQEYGAANAEYKAHQQMYDESIAEAKARLADLRAIAEARPHEVTCAIYDFGHGARCLECNCSRGAILAALDKETHK